MTYEEWCHRWPQAAAELRAITLPLSASEEDGKSEAHASGLIRNAAPYNNAILWRNNRGALLDDRGVPVRYGLLNDNSKIDKIIKSADLIGIERVLIGPWHVGHTFGRFLSVEAKKTGWKFKGGDHEGPQGAWADLVTSWGGRAVFATRPEDVW